MDILCLQSCDFPISQGMATIRCNFFDGYDCWSLKLKIVMEISRKNIQKKAKLSPIIMELENYPK